eukprot:1159641-Pelagomonas_calceolata.AAC.18
MQDPLSPVFPGTHGRGVYRLCSLDELCMEVGPHVHWLEDLPVDLGQTGCIVSGYVCVSLMERHQDASQFCSVDLAVSGGCPPRAESAQTAPDILLQRNAKPYLVTLSYPLSKLKADIAMKGKAYIAIQAFQPNSEAASPFFKSLNLSNAIHPYDPNHSGRREEDTGQAVLVSPLKGRGTHLEEGNTWLTTHSGHF